MTKQSEERTCLGRAILRAVDEGDWYLVEVLGRLMKGAEGATNISGCESSKARVAPLPFAPPVKVAAPRVRKPRAAAVVVPSPPPDEITAVECVAGWSGSGEELDWRGSPNGSHYLGYWKAGHPRETVLAAMVRTLPPGAVLVDDEEEETK